MNFYSVKIHGYAYIMDSIITTIFTVKYCQYCHFHNIPEYEDVSDDTETVCDDDEDDCRDDTAGGNMDKVNRNRFLLSLS